MALTKTIQTARSIVQYSTVYFGQFTEYRPMWQAWDFRGRKQNFSYVILANCYLPSPMALRSEQLKYTSALVDFGLRKRCGASTLWNIDFAQALTSITECKLWTYSFHMLRADKRCPQTHLMKATTQLHCEQHKTCIHCSFFLSLWPVKYLLLSAMVARGKISRILHMTHQCFSCHFVQVFLILMLLWKEYKIIPIPSTQPCLFLKYHCNTTFHIWSGKRPHATHFTVACKLSLMRA